MRKTNDARKQKYYRPARIQGYHEGAIWGSGEYAYRGFGRNLYFTSDRYIPLDEHFNRPDGQPLAGYGVEIETECYTIDDNSALAEVLEKVIFPHFPAHLFKMQRDGSLGGKTSAECITQVMTREFVRNNYGAFELMYDHFFPIFGLTCSRSGRCGMHVNISNALFGRTKDKQDEAMRKFYYIVNKFYKTICYATDRDPSNAGYAYRQDASCARTRDVERLGEHGAAFNTEHYTDGRIEFRVPGGQTSFSSFRGTMELVFWLVDRVKKISWADCDSAVKVFAGCNQYVLGALYKAYNHSALTGETYNAIASAVVEDDFEVELVVQDV